MLELAVLGLLKERSMHGYQLKKSLSETLGPFWQVSYGALYPALKRLKAQGAVEEVFPKATVGRRRNVYRLTEKGEALFAGLLESAGEREPVGDDNGFRVRLAFFRYLKPETRIGVLERRRAALMARLTELKQRLTERRVSDSYTLSLMRHGMDATERDISWVDHMIEAERRATRRPRRARRKTAAGAKEEGA
ncbi:MAG TPA: PadR family transcriptional regulator [Actinomycetota bacterium]|nr:PadR family transcriptional regulator [Actinomycetota bacterium]